MKKLLMSIAFIALVGSIVRADAASTLAIGGGFNLGHVQTGTGAASTGTLRRVRSPTGPPPTSVPASPRPLRPAASRPASEPLWVKATP